MFVFSTTLATQSQPGRIQAIHTDRMSAGWGEIDGGGKSHVIVGKPGTYQFIYAADPLTPRLGSSVTMEVNLLTNIRQPTCACQNQDG